MNEECNKVAVFDLGTNTFHMLIAGYENQKLQVLKKLNVGVKLGAGGINKGIIQPDAYHRALEAVKYLINQIDSPEFKTMPRLAYGTSMFRNAKNGPQLANDIGVLLNTEVHIISGAEEAELIYLGIEATGALSTVPALIVDIGGGSVEFVIANNRKILYKNSLEIGGQRLLDRFKPSDPLKISEKEAIQAYLRQQLVDVLHNCKSHDVKYLVGASGAFDTLAQMQVAQNILPSDRAEEFYTVLNIEVLHQHLQMLIQLSKEQRLAIPGMIPLRVEMIVVAAILIELLLAHIEPEKVIASAFALREGAAARYFRQIKVS